MKARFSLAFVLIFIFMLIAKPTHGDKNALLVTASGQEVITEEEALRTLLQARVIPTDNPSQAAATISPQYPARSNELLATSGAIAFESNRNGTFDIFQQEADGSSPALSIVSGPGNDFTPVWSPDGTQLVFASDRDGDFDIYLRTAEGDEIRLTQNTVDDGHPSWSPDGRRIIFTSNRGGGYFQIYTMLPNGSDVQQIGVVPGNNAMHPRYSPDGSQIAFMRASITAPLCEWNWDVWVMDANGNNQRRVTTLLGADLYPNWSPDGTEIVYASCRNFIDFDLYRKNVVTGTEDQLNSWFGSSEWGAAYSPDMEHLAFSSNVVGNDEIFLMPSDGGAASNLTQHSADDVAANWKESSGPLPEPQTAKVSPVYPTEHTTASSVMQGGVLYRYFHLLDENEIPIPGAIVEFSIGNTSTTDNQGYFTYTVAVDDIGGPGDISSVSVESFTYDGQVYVLSEQPAFGVVITERRYAHSWEYGSVYKGSGGISAGLVGYMAGESNGGLAMTLEESNPNTTNDDRVTMRESHSGEHGGGFGVDISPSVEFTILEIEGPGAHMTHELLKRTEAQLGSTFYQPYQTAERQAQGLMLLASIPNVVLSFPSQPLVAAIVNRANVPLPYDDFTSGFGVHERADLGIDTVRFSVEIGKKDARLNLIDINLLSATDERTVVAGNTYYADMISEFYYLDLAWEAAQLSGQPLFENQIGKYVGEALATVREEVFYNPNTGKIVRVELSVTGEGNDLEFTDIDQNRVTIRYIIPGEHVNPELLNAAHNLDGLITGLVNAGVADLRVGDAPIVAEAEGFLGNVSFAEYEITTDDGAELSLVPSISLGTNPGLNLDLGAGLDIKRGRQLIVGQGVVLNGRIYPTATYKADEYVAQPGKSWAELSGNAAGGLWDLVKEGFNWIWQQVSSGTAWVVGIIADTASGIIHGGAQVDVAPGTELYEGNASSSLTSIQYTEPITVTARSWVPIEADSNNSSITPALATASGESFVTGGIYEFQPYELAFNPAATLVVTYTNEALNGVNENQLGLFRWNPDGNNWQPLAAQADPVNNSFTASIAQLGTFAVGHDDTLPEIRILAPANGSTIANQYPQFRALISDLGTGIDPATVEMRLDGQIVDATYYQANGELLYSHGQPLANGAHTVRVKASDAVGNTRSTTATFTVKVIHKVYLPMTRR